MKTLPLTLMISIIYITGMAIAQPQLILKGDPLKQDEISSTASQTLLEKGSIDTCLHPVEFDLYITNASCPGVCDGIVEIDVTDGTPPYSYMIEADSCIGLFTVFVTDAAGCIDSVSDFILTDSDLEIFDLQITPSTNGQSDGMVEVEADNGIPPYLYSIDGVNYQFSPLFNNLPPGSYCITVLDGNGCSIKSDTFWIENTTSITSPIDPISLYPNPVNSTLYVNGKTAFHLDLLDADGVVVKSSPESASHAVEVADLPRGLYLVRMRNEMGFTFHKILLQ